MTKKTRQRIESLEQNNSHLWTLVHALASKVDMVVAYKPPHSSGGTYELITREEQVRRIEANKAYTFGGPQNPYYYYHP